MSALDCGIDIGTTNVKVALVDEEGRTVWTRSLPTPRVADDGSVATDASTLVTLLEDMILTGWQEVGRGLPLRSMATTGVGEDGVGVTAELRPTDVALPWFDSRATPEAAELRRHPAANARTGLAIAADRTVAKWLWLHRHRPAVLDQAHLWIALTDFPAVIWTGQPFMSRTLAARTAAYDVYERTWIEPLLRATGAPPLPPVVDAGTVIGPVTGARLRESGAASDATLVVAGGHDHPVAASAIRRLSRGARIDSMGTANLVYGETDGPIAPRLDPFMAFSVPVSNHPGLACLGVMELSAALEPARADPTHFAAELAREHLADQLPQDADELDTGPWTTPRGIRRRLESATLHTRRMFEAMDEAGVVPGPIYATGGYARSLAFLELRASVFGVPLFAIDEPELAAIGGALLAAEGIGAPVPELDRSRRILTIEPVPAWVRAYDDLYPAIRRRLDAAYQNNEAGGSFPG